MVCCAHPGTKYIQTGQPACQTQAFTECAHHFPTMQCTKEIEEQFTGEENKLWFVKQPKQTKQTQVSNLKWHPKSHSLI